ncbi:MAG TPA: M61 family peptidase [Phycisphaerales bacterium]|nr:M61 family peptidase [Phycisphaerales bacterium]
MKLGRPYSPPKRWVLNLVVMVFLTLNCGAQEASLFYRIDTEEIKNHRIKVTATLSPEAFPTAKREVGLPVWTPGSYKIRDYSRFLSTVECLTPGTEVVKTAKNRWEIQGLKKNQPVKLQYSVYGHELTVRTNYFTPELSLFTGAGIFVAPTPVNSENLADATCRVEFGPHEGDIETNLTSVGPGVYTATNYDELLDRPIVMGDLEVLEFQAGQTPHKLVQAGHRQYWGKQKSLADAKAPVQTVQDFWGVIPYKKYAFYNLITDTRGGLEHRDSTVVMTGRFATREREKYVAWLSLLSHEYFHTWNVKRLRPVALGPFDYEEEVYTRSLWIAEGITSYYDDLLVRRAGLSTRKEYLKALSDQLNKFYQTPGRLHISLTDASFDAWIRLYQDTDDLHNSNISYYNKGAVVAWLLDTRIRKLTQGRKTLDDVMRTAYEEFSQKGFTEAQFRKLVNKVSGHDLSSFFQRNLDSLNDLDIQEALNYWHLTWEVSSKDSKPYLGLSTGSGPRAVVEKVYQGSPAAEAGLSPGDEIIAVDEVRVPETKPLSILDNLQVREEPYTFTIARLGRIQHKQVVLSQPKYRQHELKFQETDSAKEARWQEWLGPERSDKD